MVMLRFCNGQIPFVQDPVLLADDFELALGLPGGGLTLSCLLSQVPLVAVFATAIALQDKALVARVSDNKCIAVPPCPLFCTFLKCFSSRKNTGGRGKERHDSGKVRRIQKLFKQRESNTCRGREIR